MDKSDDKPKTLEHEVILCYNYIYIYLSYNICTHNSCMKLNKKSSLIITN